MCVVFALAQNEFLGRARKGAKIPPVVSSLHSWVTSVWEEDGASVFFKKKKEFHRH